MYEKSQFIEDDLTRDSISAAFQRARIYKTGQDVKDEDKKNLRGSLWGKLQGLKPQYASSVSEIDHLSNISKLADDLSQEFSGILANSRFRIGIAQKSVNLYLKYMWCLGKVYLPPHCPFDAIIIDRLSLSESEYKGMMWTKLDSIDAYKNLVAKASELVDQSEYSSLSDWELNIHSL